MFKKEFTPQFFIRMALKHIRILILFTVIGGVVALIYANYFITPIYSATSMIFIQNYTAQDAAAEAAKQAQEQGIDDQSQEEDEALEDATEANSGSGSNNGIVKIYSSDIGASESIAEYCITLFSNNVELANMLNGCAMEMTQVPESSFVNITMTSTDPQLAADTCNAVTDRIAGGGENQSLYRQIFGAGGVTVTRYAAVPSGSSYPDVQKIALIGLAVGFVIAAAIAFLLELVDTTVKYDDDLFKLYEIPVFGEILDFNQVGGEKYAYKASDDKKS
ncbi:MAG: hypothetical protein IJV39_04310 [Ruminococcus sp.]|nr:hypothetical protein [Ruminococcus sp.]